MSNSLGSLTISDGTPAIFRAPNQGVKAILIGNTSGLNSTITMESGMVQKMLYPGMLDWFAVKPGFTGNILVSPAAVLNNVSSWPSNSLIFDAVGLQDSEEAYMYPIQLAAPAVTATASGKPIFSATVGFGSTASFYQTLNVFNPATSGVTFTFHAARVFTSDSGTPAANLLLKAGADLNLGTSVTPVSHAGSSSPPVSFAHCSAEDVVTSHGATSTIEVMDMQQNVTQDFLDFPDSVTLAPGNSLYITLTAGASSKVVRLTLKWSEDIAVAAAGGVPTTVATSIINSGNAANTPIIGSTVTGDSAQAVTLTNDGQLTLGDASHHGSISTDNGTISSNGSGVLTVAQLALALGSLARIKAIGQTTIAQAGTSVSHGLGVLPDFVLPVHDAGGQSSDVITVNYGTMTSSAFTAYSTNVAGTNNIRFLVFKF